MVKFYLPLFLLLLLVLEGVAVDFLPNSLVTGRWMIAAHWVLLYLVLISIFYDLENTYVSVLYAIAFGLMIDIVYTSVLGVYMFIYPLVVYGIHGLKKLLHTNFLVALVLSALAVALADTGVYIVYSFIGLTELPWQDYFYIRLIPTLLANVLFLLLIYPLTKQKLVKWSTDRFNSTGKL
ncbi:rod shape-determining protein MreD [Sediminibacillus dalangtanensis]|uniref:Rod shape-determining protein MreD n=1 Tax=Sediminibacillus dalangtanensis TaxID=2729421 RepID=A0ABX7VZ27_9BACI|nr:rod shape-determining protein MreD [Sediminibacillus dalangtanensis]QTM99956.1 rod shape-determining protein MreD [Sediminibacillus dalangtanensis]